MGAKESKQDTPELEHIFKQIDTAGDGFITAQELKKALLNLGQKLEDTEIHDLIKMCDSNRDNKLDFQEFVDMMTLSDEETLDKLFKEVDKDGNDELSNDEVGQLCMMFGQTVSEEEINQAIKKADADGDGRVNVDEFKAEILSSLPSTYMAEYVGKYQRTKIENFDEFLKELDVNYVIRKAAYASTPEFEVFLDGNDIKFKTSTMLKSIELKFRPGEEFVEKTFDGRTVRGIVTKEGNKFISIQNNIKEGGISTKIIREFKDDEMIQSSQVIGSATVCIQVFKRQNSKN